jgi:hypothetical protein
MSRLRARTASVCDPGREDDALVAHHVAVDEGRQLEQPSERRQRPELEPRTDAGQLDLGCEVREMIADGVAKHLHVDPAVARDDGEDASPPGVDEHGLHHDVRVEVQRRRLLQRGDRPLVLEHLERDLLGLQVRDDLCHRTPPRVA